MRSDMLQFHTLNFHCETRWSVGNPLCDAILFVEWENHSCFAHHIDDDDDDASGETEGLVLKRESFRLYTMFVRIVDNIVDVLRCTAYGVVFITVLCRTVFDFCCPNRKTPCVILTDVMQTAVNTHHILPLDEARRNN